MDQDHWIVLIDWMRQVVIVEKQSIEVFHLAVDCTLRFLARSRLHRKAYQLLGACSLLVSSKFLLDNNSLNVIKLRELTDFAYTIEDLNQFELILLQKLDWRLAHTIAYRKLTHDPKLVRLLELIYLQAPSCSIIDQLEKVAAAK